MRNDSLPLPPGHKPWSLADVPRDDRFDALIDWLTRVPDAEREDERETQPVTSRRAS